MDYMTLVVVMMPMVLGMTIMVITADNILSFSLSKCVCFFNPIRRAMSGSQPLTTGRSPCFNLWWSKLEPPCVLLALSHSWSPTIDLRSSISDHLSSTIDLRSLISEHRSPIIDSDHLSPTIDLRSSNDDLRSWISEWWFSTAPCMRQAADKTVGTSAWRESNLGPCKSDKFLAWSEFAGIKGSREVSKWGICSVIWPRILNNSIHAFSFFIFFLKKPRKILSYYFIFYFYISNVAWAH